MQSDSSWPHGRTGVNTFKHTKVTLWPSVMFRWQADCLLRPHIATFLLQKGFKKDICALQTTHNCTWLTSDPKCTSESRKCIYFGMILIILINKHLILCANKHLGHAELQRPITFPHWLSSLLLVMWPSGMRFRVCSSSRSLASTHILCLVTLLSSFLTPAVLWASVSFGCRTLTPVCSAWMDDHILGITLNLCPIFLNIWSIRMS